MKNLFFNIVVKHLILKKCGLQRYDAGLWVRGYIVAEEGSVLVCDVERSKTNII
jgi:hypothetical protein